jgi:hypothetical protein
MPCRTAAGWSGAEPAVPDLDRRGCRYGGAHTPLTRDERRLRCRGNWGPACGHDRRPAGPDLPGVHLQSGVPRRLLRVGVGAGCLDWELTDPAGKTAEQIRPIRDDIERRVRGLLAELTGKTPH